MATYYEIPLVPGQGQVLQTTLQGVTYTLKVVWNPVAACWVMDILDETGLVPILRGVPLVTGHDLLEQYEYLYVGSNAAMMVTTVGVGESPDEVPTFSDLGIDGKLYYVTG